MPYRSQITHASRPLTFTAPAINEHGESIYTEVANHVGMVMTDRSQGKHFLIFTGAEHFRSNTKTHAISEASGI